MPVQLGSAYGKIDISTDGVVRGIAAAQTALSNFEKQTKAVGQEIARAGDQLTMSLTLPLAGLGAAAGKAAMGFEASMQQIVGLVGVAQSQVDAWKGDLEKLGPAIGRGPKELADALYFVTSAGIKGAAALDIVTQSGRAASAGLGDTKIIADAASSALNAYGQQNLTAGKAIGILVATVREGKAEASEIAPAIGRVIPIAAQLGVTFDQVGAAIAAQTRVGFDAAESVTNLSGILSAFLKPGKQASDVLKEFGLSGEQVRKTLREQGLLATLTLLRDTIGNDDEALAKIFPNIRGFRGLLSLVGENAASTRDVFAALANTTEADLDKAFEAASQTMKFKFDAALSTVQTGLIKLGNAVLPVVIPMLQDLAKTIQNLTDWFAKLPAATQQTIVQVLAIVAALGPLMAIGGRLISTIGTLTGIFRTLAIGVFGAVGRITEFVQVAALARSPMEALRFIFSSTAVQLGLLAAGLVVIVKFIEAVGVAAKATNEELMQMAHSGDLFQQAAASYEILAHGADRIAVTFESNQEKMQQALIDGAMKLDDYNQGLIKTAEAAGLATDVTERFGKSNLDALSAAELAANGWIRVGDRYYEVDSRVKLLTEDQRDLMRQQAAVEQGAKNQAATYAVLDAAMRRTSDATGETTSALKAEIDAAKDAARAQEELAKAQEAVNAQIDNLRGLMAGAVGKELQDFATKQDELKTKAAELQQTISTSYGKAKDDAVASLAEVNQELLANAQAHDDATKRILFDMLQQQLAADGFTQAEVNALTMVAERWGLVDSATTTAQLGIIAAVTQLAKDNNLDAFGANMDRVLGGVKTAAAGTSSYLESILPAGVQTLTSTAKDSVANMNTEIAKANTVLNTAFGDMTRTSQKAVEDVQVAASTQAPKIFAPLITASDGAKKSIGDNTSAIATSTDSMLNLMTNHVAAQAPGIFKPVETAMTALYTFMSGKIGDLLSLVADLLADLTRVKVPSPGGGAPAGLPTPTALPMPAPTLPPRTTTMTASAVSGPTQINNYTNVIEDSLTGAMVMEQQRRARMRSVVAGM